MNIPNNTWQPNSWQNKISHQQPEYIDKIKLKDTLGQIKLYPPIVSIGEIQSLQKNLKEVALGRRFILQGGDCAERFIDCREGVILNKLKILLQMSLILTYSARKGVVRIGRIAGQYAKPRSQMYETIQGQQISTYRGDAVNEFHPNKEAREPDPARLLSSYHHSVITLNFIRSAIAGGFADLRHPYHWNIYSMEKSPRWEQYRDMVERIMDAVHFLDAVQATKSESLDQIDFYISHEGLLLNYEESLTRKDSSSGLYYNLGAHTLWIGERTRQLNGGHIEYFRGIANPIGVKIGPQIEADELLDLIAALNPDNDPGRLTLIARMGHKHITEKLPPLVTKVARAKKNVIWSCDPMHGNILTTSKGIKTRNFEDILGEITQSFRILKEAGSFLGGLHFELTGDDVTECLGGATGISELELNSHYETYCDPRLNYSQSLEIAFLIAHLAKENI